MGKTNILHELENNKEIVIYGQIDYVKRIKIYLKKINPNIKLIEKSFPLSIEEREKECFDFDLYREWLINTDKEKTIFAIFSMKYHEIVENHLSKYNFSNVYYYTASVENDLRRKYLLISFKSLGKEYNDIYTLPDEHIEYCKSVDIYMSKCVVDKPVKTGSSNMLSCVIPIQSGKALTDEKIADVTDDEGENISYKNKKYSEMTAAYWAWKHSTADFIGMCHYRRHFVLPEIIIEKLKRNDIDVVLPLPTIYVKSIREEYFHRHIPTVWQIMLNVLNDFYPEYMSAAKEIFSGAFFYGNNMWILKRKVLDEFFFWMFPMLVEIEKRVGDIADPYYNRYIGFCTELFTTLYFWDNRKKLKIVHAEKTFII